MYKSREKTKKNEILRMIPVRTKKQPSSLSHSELIEVGNPTISTYVLDKFLKIKPIKSESKPGKRVSFLLDALK